MKKNVVAPSITFIFIIHFGNVVTVNILYITVLGLHKTIHHYKTSVSIPDGKSNSTQIVNHIKVTYKYMINI